MLHLNKVVKVLLLNILILTSFGISALAESSDQEHLASNEEIIEAQNKKISQATENANKVLITGEATIELADQGSLTLPKGFVFVPKKEANELMKSWGHLGSESLVGIITSEGDFEGVILLYYHDVGYIKDNDANHLDENSLLEQLQDSAKEYNKRNKKLGLREAEIVGFAQKPFYDASKHQLIYSVIERGIYPEKDPLIQAGYFINTLGKEGHFSSSLSSPYDSLEKNKIYLEKILSSLKFKEGKRYEDFLAGTDRVAEYGLAGLITGVVAKKLGLLALAWVFLLKIWKFAAVGLLVFWSRIKNLFNKMIGSNENIDSTQLKSSRAENNDFRE